MFLTEKEIIFLFFLFMLLFLVWSYLQVCDFFVGRIVYKVFMFMSDLVEGSYYVTMVWHTKETLTIATVTTAVCMVVFVGILCLCMIYYRRQKTRTPPPRRMFVGTRARQSLTQAEPTIYVSPNNFPPPPKYECLAPPSYEEVVGIHYPQYQNQPITQPIATAMATAQTSATNVTEPPVVVTVTSETRTTVPASSS